MKVYWQLQHYCANVAVSETRLKEIMIDTPPQITPSTLSLTKVTPITGQSTVWTSPPLYGMLYFVQSMQ